jgi:hypothetical protein
MKKTIAVTVLTLCLAFFAAGCSAADVVLKYSPGSFAKIVKAYPDIVTDTTKTDHYYSITVDGETTLKISHDYSLTGSNDIMITTPLKPFTDAGLDTSKLGVGYAISGDMFELTADYGNGTGMKDTVTDSLFDSVKADRTMLTYHSALDHYGIKLTNGKFEYAKDYTNNDKDLVFVFAANPLKALGVDVKNVSGWTFKTMQNEDGSFVDVLLKAYDLDAK